MRRAMAGTDAPKRWTAAVGLALRARVAARKRALANENAWTQNAAAMQIHELRKLLEAAAETEIGREHGFGRIARLPAGEVLAAYRSELGVCDWYAFADRIARMREGGEPDVLWPGLVRDYAQTSGTTAGDKFIPVSSQMFRANYLASLDIFAHLERMGMSLTDIMSGRCLFLGGSSDVTENEHGVRTGDLSGLVTKLIRWPLSAIYSPGPEVALESDWPTKIEKMARLTIEQDIRFISGMPSWATVLFERVIELANERGRNVDRIEQVWPHLRVFVHGGVNYRPFVPRVSALWSGDAGRDIPHRFELYPASEGFIAMQDAAAHGPDAPVYNRANFEAGKNPSLRLFVDNGIFFEFVPLDEIESENPRALACWEVETGVRYVVVMSTCAGLWRYVIGDVVEFDTVPAGPDGRGGSGPARLRIVGRHKHFINAFGENLIVEHIEHAVERAARESGLTVGEFTAAPVYPDGSRRAGLELAVEVAEGRERLEPFGAAFDAALKAQNVDYTTKRGESLGMVEPVITPLPVGAFHAWLESKGKLGGQHKCPRCANHRDVLDGVVGAVQGR